MSLTWDDLHARRTPCLRCRWAGPLAGPFSSRGRERIHDALARKSIDIIRLIREDAACGLGEAKGTYQHLVDKPGECHWCAAPIPPGELVDCPHCGALNISL